MDDLDNEIEFDKEEKINCVEGFEGDDLTFVEVRSNGFSLMSYRVTFRNYIAAGVYEEIKGGLNYIHYVNDCEEILKYRK
jgi:hypothetical protein